MLAVTHLLEQGHRRIAFIGGPLTTVQVADRIAAAPIRAQMVALTEDLAVLLTDGRFAEGQRRRALLGLPRAVLRGVLRMISARPPTADGGRNHPGRSRHRQL
jgi:DNA-binding LacI/PurR family transcriptional regulator